MAEHDDLDFDYGAPRKNPFDREDRFQGNPRARDEVLDDYASESANDDYLDDDFDEDDFISDDFDADDYGYDDDEFEYQSTPPGAFYNACMRQLQHGPRLHGDLDSIDPAGAEVTSRGLSQDRGPSYAL